MSAVSAVSGLHAVCDRLVTRLPAMAVALLFAATPLLPGGDATAQEEIVTRGNQAYQEGGYATAIEAYESVLEAGFVSAGLEYNLGNAYFKSGELGPAILHWERALVLSPGDADVRANLELARSITVDAVEPLPNFWLFSALRWWVDLLPRRTLMAVVATSWLMLTGGAIVRITTRSVTPRRVGSWLMAGGGVALVLFGANLFVRELGIARPERAIILDAAVAVRSAPAEDDDLTLFEVHEGTRVRIDERTGDWAEVVLDDGKVGWVPVEVMEVI